MIILPFKVKNKYLVIQTVKNLIKNCALKIYNFIITQVAGIIIGTGSIGTQYVIVQGGHKLLGTL